VSVLPPPLAAEVVLSVSTGWLIAGAVLLAGAFPLLWVCLRGSILEALVAVELAGTITTLVLLVIAQGTHRQPFFDLALVSALLSFGGGLAFARFLERWV
jgi:multicomponent Na+:H+ antiporter subunit F